MNRKNEKNDTNKMFCYLELDSVYENKLVEI